MYSEDDLWALSALQHILFCQRQCALIHIERVWAENRFTAEGNVLHERTDKPGVTSENGVRVARGMMLRSLRLGVYGIADVVEFHQSSEGEKPFPVEYKRGKPKENRCDEVQLCAQAMCLEEMFDCSISKGALFYGQTRRRKDAYFSKNLREQTESAAEKLHKLIQSGQTPPPVFTKQCRSCSLIELCKPKSMSRKKSVKRYVAGMIREEQS